MSQSPVLILGMATPSNKVSPLMTEGFALQATQPKRVTRASGLMILIINRPLIKAHDSPIVCQFVIKKKGYVALKCYNIFNHSYQPYNIPQSLAIVTLENFSLNEWIANNGASTHMTCNSGMLKNLCQYFGPNVVIVGNSSTYAITHVGNTYINNCTNKIKLCNILLVSALSNNLLPI